MFVLPVLRTLSTASYISSVILIEYLSDLVDSEHHIQRRAIIPANYYVSDVIDSGHGASRTQLNTAAWN